MSINSGEKRNINKKKRRAFYKNKKTFKIDDINVKKILVS